MISGAGLFATFVGAVMMTTAVTATAGVDEPLFASSEMIRLTIRAPFDEIVRNAERSKAPHDALLQVQGAAPESHAIKVSARGITRRKRETCAFPPMRIEFAQKVAGPSLFEGQKRLKLVTHCRRPETFQQYTLLEYGAYRLFNVLTPVSLRVRLASIDYVKPGEKTPFLTRVGFIIEDPDAAAGRNTLHEIETGNIKTAQLSPEAAARYAVFQYMIGNLDWSMNAGPTGESCCHNSKLLSASKSSLTGLIPLPYDFDFSGLIDAPYATPPDQVPVATVRTRRYRGLCRHNPQALVAAGEARAARGSLQAALREIPHLDEKTRGRASAYLAEFFQHVATDANVADKLLKTCI